ncbi:MAG: FAD-dependent oxidoreductase [Gemmatimonadota bacterium]
MIGGGIAGLAAAHFLLEAGASVEVFEAAPEFGGLGSTFRHDGRSLDRFYHVVLPSDDALLALCEDLGVRDRFYWRDASLGFLHRRRLYALRGPLDLLRFDAAAFSDRIRLGLTAVWASSFARPDRLDRLTAREWLTKLSGKRAFDRFWRPLLEAKFGDAYQEIPALWYWASFRREKGTKKEVKGYPRGGYGGLTEALVGSLGARGAVLETGTAVDRLDLEADGRIGIDVDGGTRLFDRVVSTVPFATLRRITAGGTVGAALSEVDHPIDYQGVINVVVLLRRSLSPYYWVPVVDSGVPFQGIVETTRVIDLEDTGGMHLVYLLNYVHRTDPLYGRDSEELAAEYVGALRELFPDLTSDDVLGTRVFRAPFVEPIYTPGYGERKPPIELVPGRVFLATTTQIYPEVTSWNSSTRLSKRVVNEMRRSAEARV